MHQAQAASSSSNMLSMRCIYSDTEQRDQSYYFDMRFVKPFRSIHGMTWRFLQTPWLTDFVMSLTPKGVILESAKKANLFYMGYPLWHLLSSHFCLWSHARAAIADRMWAVAFAKLGRIKILSVIV